jgi:hypothetical protein
MVEGLPFMNGSCMGASASARLVGVVLCNAIIGYAFFKKKDLFVVQSMGENQLLAWLVHGKNSVCVVKGFFKRKVNCQLGGRE